MNAAICAVEANGVVAVPLLSTPRIAQRGEQGLASCSCHGALAAAASDATRARSMGYKQRFEGLL